MEFDISNKQAGLLASIPTGALIAELEKRLADLNLMRTAAARMLSTLSSGPSLGGPGSATAAAANPVGAIAMELEAGLGSEEERAKRAGLTLSEYREVMQRAMDKEAAKTAEKKQKDEDRLAAMRAGYKGKGATARWIADGRPSSLGHREQEQPENSTPSAESASPSDSHEAA